MISMTWPQYLRQECSYKGWRTPLSAIEAEVLLVLLLRRNADSSTAFLVEAIYHDDPDGGPLSAESSTRQVIGRLRAKLPGAIRGRHDWGYHLTTEEKTP